MLDAERQFYSENKSRWIERYGGRFVAVHGRDLVGVFNTQDEAMAEAARRFGLEPCLIRRVTQEEPQASAPALTLGILSANPACTVPDSSHGE
jgi:hypothetical protein